MILKFDYAELLLHTITKARRNRNGRKLRRQERKLEREIKKELEKQADYIIRRAKKIIPRKDYEDEVDGIFENLPDKPLKKTILETAGIVMTFGALSRIKDDNLSQIGISFDLEHPLAVQYLKTDRPLILAKMSETTKEHIKPLLIRAAKEGLSPQQVAKEISENFAFSKARSLMIATNEIGTAYGYGNWVVMNDVAEEGYDVKKQWLTVGDDRVTDECRANESMGWIKFDEQFESGDDNAPRGDHPRCRCDTLYEYK